MQSLVLLIMPADVLSFITTRIKKTSVWKTKCREVWHSPVPVDQLFRTRCMLCQLQSWRCQLASMPRKTMQRAQNS